MAIITQPENTDWTKDLSPSSAQRGCSSTLSHLQDTEHCPSPLESKWKELLLNYIGVTCGEAVQSNPGEPVLTAIKSLGSGGSNTVFCRGCSFMPPFASLSDSTFDRYFGFNGTHLASALRLGVRVIPAAVDEAENTEGFRGASPDGSCFGLRGHM